MDSGAQGRSDTVSYLRPSRLMLLARFIVSIIIVSVGSFILNSLSSGDIPSLMIGMAFIIAGIVFLVYVVSMATGMSPSVKYYEFQSRVAVIVAKAEIELMKKNGLANKRAEKFIKAIDELYED